MIGAFPDLYPDEMLTSGWARYEAWVGYRRRAALLEELFGGKKYSLVFDLPAPLGYFAAALPPGHSAASVDLLIRKHTLFPYYTAFMPAEKIAAAYDVMQGEHSAKIHTWAGLSGREGATPRFLRYCPCCVTDDRERYGETYWHRIHQAAGVEVCPQHAVWLEPAHVPMWMVKGTTTFITAETAIPLVDARLLDEGAILDQKLLRLAQNVQWLLEHPGLNAETFCLDERFHLELVARGLSTHNRHRKLSQILSDIREALTPDLLAYVGCDWPPDSYEHCWATRLLRDTRDGRFALYRLLLVLFFAESVASFLQLPATTNAFGDGPWPCLNPACRHYRQSTIQVCEMDFSHKGLPRGTFACDCGFVYSRVGPDTRPEDRYRIGTVLARGAVWEEALRVLWLDPTVNAREMERRMHSSWQYLRRHATQMGLPFPPPGVRPAPRTTTPLAPSSTRRIDSTPYRAAWLEVRAQYPEAGVKALRQKVQNLYFWLRNHDRAWLNAHLPDRQSWPHHLHTDWEQRDRDMVVSLEAAFERLRHRQDPLLRISANALLTESGRRSQFQHNRYRLPLSSATLEQLAESHEDFAVRRIWHVAHGMYKNGVIPRRYVLVDAAGVGRYGTDHPRVQTTIDAALTWLQSPDDVAMPGDNFILRPNITMGDS
jgi:hypothetical protein